MAKDVSVRLHDELDLLEEKRGKMEEENRHLTELLEQADRKQFRLELEVDKLRDKVRANNCSLFWGCDFWATTRGLTAPL